VLLILKVAIAVAVALAIYLGAAAIVRSFTVPPPPDPDPERLRPVHFRFRCIVCGSEVTMTAAPDGELPDPPRHCREDMSLVVEGGDW
jgi:hypothetical protein